MFNWLDQRNRMDGVYRQNAKSIVGLECTAFVNGDVYKGIVVSYNEKSMMTIVEVIKTGKTVKAHYNDIILKDEE